MKHILVSVKNQIWHKRCFSCGDCHRSLDSTNLNDGPDHNIYCRSCYGKHFGPKGVGFGMGAGTLTMAWTHGVNGYWKLQDSPLYKKFPIPSVNIPSTAQKYRSILLSNIFFYFATVVIVTLGGDNFYINKKNAW